jgi:hypothetical protein
MFCTAKSEKRAGVLSESLWIFQGVNSIKPLSERVSKPPVEARLPTPELRVEALPKRRNNALNATDLANAAPLAALQSALYTGVYGMRKKNALHLAPPPLASEPASLRRIFGFAVKLIAVKDIRNCRSCLNQNWPEFKKFSEFSHLNAIYYQKSLAHCFQNILLILEILANSDSDKRSSV